MTGPTVTKAARRDASFYVKPGWSGKYHVVIDSDDAWLDGAAACSPPGPARPGTTERRWGRMLLDPDSAVPVTEVPIHQRCGRPGCRQRWTQDVPR